MTQPRDPLGIRTASRFVMERAHFVRIDLSSIGQAAADILESPMHPAVTTWHQDHLASIKLTPAELANFVLVLDALNFYFWGEPRWRVTDRGETEDGYWALTMALRRALREGFPITDAKYLATIPASDVAQILRGESIIPMFSTRVQHLREVGESLVREYDGSFLRCIEECRGSGLELLRRIITLFPSFVDVRYYASRTIPFYKRAQILVSDLAAAFESNRIELFDDLTFLTAFADYKVPQVLHQLGVLRYHPDLESKLRRMELIPVNFPQEVEIRAGTIVAVDRIAQETSRAGTVLPDYAIDWHLWALGQHERDGRLPYHRTPTVAY
jgi:hypothetical protein